MIIENNFELLMVKKIIKRNGLNTQQLSIMNRAIRAYEPKKLIVKNDIMLRIQNIVADYYAVESVFYDKDCRDLLVVNGRQIVWYFTEIYYKNIPLRVRGLHFGLDHATSRHGYLTIKRELSVNKQLQEEIISIDKKIRAFMGLEYLPELRHF